MEEGLLWRDGRLGDLAEKIVEAATAYKEKFGRRPNRCHLHPRMVPEGDAVPDVAKVTVVIDPHVLPNEFWIGIHEDKECPARACPGPD